LQRNREHTGGIMDQEQNVMQLGTVPEMAGAPTGA
jgi:hypothetical protein